MGLFSITGHSDKRFKHKTMDSIQILMVYLGIIGLYSENSAKCNNVLWPNGFFNNDAGSACTY
jgi:hypothetical protein